MAVIDEPCLALNRNWQVVSFIPVKTAVCNVLRDMASVLDTKNYLLLDWVEWCASQPETDRWIKTARDPMPAPDIVLLKQYGERPPRRVLFTRPNLARRDAFTCQYCGIPLPVSDMTVDHVLPRAAGGVTSWDNVVAACSSCNEYKADRTPKEAGMRLRSLPQPPGWRPKLPLPAGPVRASWVPFLQKEAAL